jgi:Acetyltransferases, including N-acetylases of ribosomal proteins
MPDVFDFDLVFQTDTIVLRPLISADYQWFEKLTGDAAMWIYFTSDLSEKTALQNWVNSAITDIQNKTRLAFTILDKPTNQPIGSTSFGNISYRDQRVEIGWTWIAKDFQGTGVNRQVKYLMMKYAFETLHFERVEFKTDVLNMPARKALLRIGTKEEGILRSHTLMTHNRRRDTMYYSVLKPEWDDLKSKNDLW